MAARYCDQLSICNRKRSRKKIVGEEAQSREVSQHANESGGKRRNRSRLRDEKPCPRVKKSSQGAVTIADVNIFATRLRLHGAQFGVSQCSKERKQSAHQPGQINQLGRAGSLHHLGGNQKDSAADNGADHDRRGMT